MKLKWFFVKIFLFLFGSRLFSKIFLQSLKSQAYAQFCEEVYGRNLCQANMVDEEQLQKLISVAALSPAKNFLDLGCGIGVVSEYISDVSGASVLGIDFAKGAIESANHRTIAKRNKIEFRVGNLNSIALSGSKFDCILSLDTLYFVNDIAKTILGLKALLKAKGKLLIFYTSKVQDLDQEIKRQPEWNDLGKALTGAGFLYKTWDFTENEKEIWKRSQISAMNLKSQFEKEGNLEICKGRLAEARKNLKWQERGLITRSLYCATLNASDSFNASEESPLDPA